MKNILVIALAIVIIVLASGFYLHLDANKGSQYDTSGGIEGTIHTLSIQIFTPTDDPLICYIDSVTFSFKLRFYTVYEEGSGILTSSTFIDSKTSPTSTLHAEQGKFIYNFDPSEAEELTKMIQKTEFKGDPGPMDCFDSHLPKIEEPTWWFYIKTEKDGKIERLTYYLPVSSELTDDMRELNRYIYDNFVNESIKELMPELTQKLSGE